MQVLQRAQNVRAAAPQVPSTLPSGEPARGEALRLFGSECLSQLSQEPLHHDWQHVHQAYLTGFKPARLSTGVTTERNATQTNCTKRYLAALGVHSDCSYAPRCFSNAARDDSVPAEAWHTSCHHRSSCRPMPSTRLLNSASISYVSMYGCMTE